MWAWLYGRPHNWRSVVRNKNRSSVLVFNSLHLPRDSGTWSVISSVVLLYRVSQRRGQGKCWQEVGEVHSHSKQSDHAGGHSSFWNDRRHLGPHACLQTGGSTIQLQ